MKLALRKITYREIWRSRGRFLAIMLIVMLGAGFLAGLKVTRTAMIKTLDDYNSENKFFDFEVISTLGLTDDDVSAFAALSGVESAEGTVSTDAIFAMSENTESVLKVHSIPQSVNKLKLREGRMPQSADECVLDALFTDPDIIGSTITLMDSNDSDTLSMFSGRKFKVVGLVNSPLYINFTRGTTTIGSGSVKGFVYMPAETFTVDYYTEAYIRLASTGGVYTDQYKKAVDAFRPTLEAAAQERAQQRYKDVVADANSQYSSAVDKYNSSAASFDVQKAAAYKKLADAKAQLDAAEASLPEKRAELDSGWDQYYAAKAQLDSGWAEYNKQAAAAQPQLEQAKEQLDSGWAQYNQALEAYNQRVAAFGELLTALEKARLDASKAQLDAAQAQYDQSVNELAAAKQKLESSQTQVDDAYAKLEQGEKDYTAGVEKIKQGRADYEAGMAQANSKFAQAQQALSAGQANLVNAKVKIGSIEAPTVYVLDRNTNSGYTSFESDSKIVEDVAKVFPIFFFLVSALVCVTTMNRMVDEERTQIGTLKSLGYNSWEIMRGYLTYTGIASGAGSFIGVCIGMAVFPKIIWMGYNIMYGFTNIELVFDWKLAAIVCGAFIVCSLAVTWLSCRSELRQSPAELIRPRTPKAGKRILLEKIPFIWNRFSFLRKVSARNIFRYKKRMLMMIVGIAGCTALLLTGFGINDSITGLADTQFSEVSLYDAMLNFRGDMTAEDQAAFLKQCGDTVKSAAFLSMYSVNADINGQQKAVYLVGTDTPDMTPFMRFALDGEVQAYPGDGETIINDNLARILGVKKGDTITLEDGDHDTITLKVTGIFYNVIYNYAYVNMNTLRSAKGFETGVNAAYVNFADGADPYQAAAKAGSSDYVMAITISQQTMDLVGKSLESMKYIVGLITFCAGALAFIVLYNLTNININERIREIATIKVLGFRQWETASYVYRENMVLTLMGIACGIPLGIWLHRYVMANIRIDMVSYDVKILPMSFVIAVALTIVFAIIVDFVMYFRLDRINMAESLKSVE
jgi:putative ABC transport system permease protein